MISLLPSLDEESEDCSLNSKVSPVYYIFIYSCVCNVEDFDKAEIIKM